jgi:saccharopine dehydrogenase-like NADP-dependent oxidoreductase
MSKVVVFGGGRVGSAMALDLAVQHEVKVCDLSQDALNEIKQINTAIRIQQADLQSASITELIEDADLAICAVPGFMGFDILKKIIDTGSNVVDISFFPENALELDEMALSKGVTAIVDCGVAPGMGNIILGRYHHDHQVRSYECLVGGLPVKRQWPFEYKAVFSPIDVIEEYIRPARYVQNGELVTREALSEPELVEFEEVGTLESFNTDGLRSLIHTMDIPYMIEKTLRYPGTIEYLKVLRDSGYFSYEPVSVNGCRVRPIDLTSKLLFPKWKLNPGEADFTIMRIVINFVEDGKEKKAVFNLYDLYDHRTQITSMARTTGYTATAAANLILAKGYSRKGIIPPEFLGENKEDFQYILSYLEDRGIVYRFNEK